MKEEKEEKEEKEKDINERKREKAKCCEVLDYFNGWLEIWCVRKEGEGDREGRRREEKNVDGDVVYLSFKHKCSSLFVQPSDFSLTVIFTSTGLRV